MEEHELAAVQRLRSSDAGAPTNPDEVLAQLQKGPIRSLLVARDISLALRDCPKCRFASTAADPVCAECGTRRGETETTLGELLARVAARRSVAVDFVNGQAAELLRQTEGLSGWLAPDP